MSLPARDTATQEAEGAREQAVAAGTEHHPQNAGEEKNFGEYLRHELNNPLTGILGNAELLLVELRRQNIALPDPAQHRLETIAALAVRMREQVRVLSDRWESEAAAVHKSRPQAGASETTSFNSIAPVTTWKA